MEVKSRKENVLLGRTELELILGHDAKGTPKREEVQKKVAESESTKPDLVIVQRLVASFGKGSTHGWAHVYKSAEELKKLEPHHLLVRHKLAEKKMKAPPKEEPSSQSAAPAAPKK